VFSPSEVYLVSALHDTDTNMKGLEKRLGAKSGNLRFADEALLTATLGVARGAVSPLALLNVGADAPSVILVLDEAMKEHAALCFHPMDSAATVSLALADFTKFLNSFESLVPKWIDFKKPLPEAKGGKGGGGGKKGKQQRKGSDQKVTKLGVSATKVGQFDKWYTDTITKAEMIEYYDVSGCYILRPWSYTIWDFIKDWFDAEIKKLGVQNCYFPIFVTQKALCAEEDHIEGFAAEVAWVTKSGQSELAEPIAVRPTSETIMYPAYAKWIRSHRDLPMRLNQWNNVVRWEFKHPVPFLRSREFLWQEGHTAFATKAEADKEVKQILDLYKGIYETLLCVPVIQGVKSEEEKFAGGLYTTTIEAFIPTNGRGIQAATSHCLGTNFSDIFGIEFEDVDKQQKKVWQNSWGCTTRSIGVAVMVHGDDKGLVLPPRVAPLQVVIVPIYKGTPEEKAALDTQCELVQQALIGVGIRSKFDNRQDRRPGWKYNHWELKGVPVRIEVGAKDLETKTAMFVRRDTGAKETVPRGNIAGRTTALLATIQTEMLQRATEIRDARVTWAEDWKAFMGGINAQNMVRAPWCEDKACEENVKVKSAEGFNPEDGGENQLSGKVKSLCIPFDQPRSTEGMKCVCPGCPNQPRRWTLFGRSY